MMLMRAASGSTSSTGSVMRFHTRGLPELTASSNSRMQAVRILRATRELDQRATLPSKNTMRHILKTATYNPKEALLRRLQRLDATASALRHALDFVTASQPSDWSKQPNRVVSGADGGVVLYFFGSIVEGDGSHVVFVSVAFDEEEPGCVVTEVDRRDGTCRVAEFDQPGTALESVRRFIEGADDQAA